MAARADQIAGWKAKHPKRVRELNRRAAKAYRERRKRLAQLAAEAVEHDNQERKT